MKKKLLSFILVFAFVLTSMTTPVLAMDFNSDNSDNSDNNAETYAAEDLGGTLTRTIDGTKIIAVWSSFDGAESYTVIREGENIYLNGELFGDYDSITNKVMLPDTCERTPLMNLTATSITWGSWEYFNEQVNTGGLPVAIIAGLIAVVAPWMGLRLITTAIGVTAGYSTYYIISGRIRYGTDDTYLYYQRYTSLIDDDGRYVINNFYGSGKTPLDNNGGAK